MKSTLFFLFFFCSTLLFAQSDTVGIDSITRKELAEIIILSKREKEIQFHTFDLTGKKFFKNHSLRLPLSFRGNTSTGIFVPITANKNLVIDRVSFPVYFFTEKDKTLPLQYYIGLKYGSGLDTLIEIIPEKITVDDNETRLIINQDIRLLQVIQGFYFFIKDTAPDSSGHSNINIFYNNKYKSHLSYKLNNIDKIEAYNLIKWVKAHTSNPDDTKQLKSLNWSIKITYAGM